MTTPPRLDILVAAGDLDDADDLERLVTCLASLRREADDALPPGGAGGAPAWRAHVAAASPAARARLAADHAGDLAAGRLAFLPPATPAPAPAAPLLLLLDPAAELQCGAVAALLAPFDAPDARRLGAVAARVESSCGVLIAPAALAWRGGRLRPVPHPPAAPPLDALPGAAVLLRRAALASAGGLDARLAGSPDAGLDLALRLAAAGWSLARPAAARVFLHDPDRRARRVGPGRARDLAEADRLVVEARHHRAAGVSSARWAAAVARDVAAEWARGGPFHLTRGLLHASRRA